MDSKLAARIRIGTSGRVYKEWANDSYRGIAAREQHAFYAIQFPTVKVNATFYRFPSFGMGRGLAQPGSKRLCFAVKGSRFITQLPPSLKEDLPRLYRFLRRLPKSFSHTVEFRDPSSLEAETLELLRRDKVVMIQ